MRIFNLYLVPLVFSICSLLLLGGALAPSHAQDSESQQPRKVDTYDDKIGGSEAEQWRLEDFREVLLKEPNSQAYVIAYNGREDNPGKARRYSLRAKNYLVEARGIIPQRIVTIEGGRREEFAVELWIVPKGSEPPQLTSTITEQSDLSDNLLYDSYSPGYDNFGKYEDAEARLDGFAIVLKKEPAAWGCIISYAQNGDDRMGMEWDLPGTAQKMSQGVKNYLVKKHRFAPSRVTVVDGGYSEGRSVELWIMRPRARFDQGPFVYSHKLRARRDGTLTITNQDTLDMCCKACMRGGTDVYMFRNEEKRRPK